MTLPRPRRTVRPLLLPLALCLSLTACAELPRLADLPARPAAGGQSADRLDEAAISRLLRDTPQTAGPALQSQATRLLALGKRRAALDQLQLAMLLLARGEPGDAELAQNLLEGLPNRVADLQARNFVALLQRDAAQQLALQQAQKTAQSLQKQIDQIKSLETQLQNRSR
ncbi:MAG: hypothetical protein B7Z83_03480 [Thiomonas sp. 20-64-5]|nr:MAG: hypothetical protein B7Z83_03480 [Thiomonas sp. 20-64-5]